MGNLLQGEEFMTSDSEQAVIRVVLSDDHPIVRAGIRQMLDVAEDILVIGEASNGIQAYELTVKLMPDVLLLDMEMPLMNGIEVAKRLQDENHGVRILALSAYDSVDFIQGILANGAYGYLTKEELPETIVEAVRGVAGGKKDWLSTRARQRMELSHEKTSDVENRLADLSEREREVLVYIAQGCDNLTIAESLFISERTVKNHASNIYSKMGFHSRAEAVAWTWGSGIISGKNNI